LTKQANYYLSTSRGCLGNCSYCGVRFAVGKLKSKPLDAVLTEFSRGIERGYKDFSVIGDDVGGYGQDCGSTFSELIAALQGSMDKTKSTADFKLHIEEINPRWINKYGDDLIKLFSSRNVKSILCPIQSGNNRILSLMNRNDDIDKLMGILNVIRRNNLGLELNTQIIIGFPTETEAEFDDSLKKLTKVSFNSVTLFPYDDKENTKSYEMHPKVPESVKQDRIKKAQTFLRQQGIKSALCCNE
jgi:tRNA A37 methylthiotransferase MiaB